MFRAIVFDAYGTLFDVDAAARRVAAEPGRTGFAAVWPKVAADWRRKQLEYTWIRAITDTHADFWQVTRDALDWSLDASGMAEHDLRDRLLALYWELDAFPEVAETLDQLRAEGFATAILSNGTPELIEAAARHSGLGDRFDALISVEATGVFKPAAKVYDLACARFACRPAEILFVSSNGWDVCSAAAYGFRTIWVNRGRAPAERLAAAPDREGADLTAVPEAARVLGKE